MKSSLEQEVAELKAELEKRQLNQDGGMKALRKRLIDALAGAGGGGDAGADACDDDDAA